MAWTDPTSVLVPAGPGPEGALIDQLRSECGIILQTVDWVARKLGFDLIGAIFEPLAGDYPQVDGMRKDWQAISVGLEEIGSNYTALAGSIPESWTGDAAAAAEKKIKDLAEAHGIQAEAAGMMSQQLGHMLAAVQEICKVVANLLSLLEEVVLSLSIAKWLKEIATGGSGIRKAIRYIDKAIDAIRNLNNVIPPMLKALACIGLFFRGLNTLFMFPMSSGKHAEAGNHVDDTAAAGFR